MRLLTAILLTGILLPGRVLGQSASQDNADLVARMKSWAADYDRRLQDFLCTQQMTRYQGSTGPSPGWKRLEQQELEVSYQRNKVGYHRVKVDGKTDKLEQRVKKGYLTPGGEFAAMSRVFDPKAAADFTFDHRETREGHPFCVFRYQVPLERTNIKMHVNLEVVPVGYKGSVDADCETAEVHTVRIATDPGIAHFGKREIPVGLKLEVRYEPIEISGNGYLLPRHADLTGLFNTRLTRADLDFSNYRKYSSNSTISSTT